MLLDITIQGPSAGDHQGGLLVTFSVYADGWVSGALRQGACVYLLTSAPPADWVDKLSQLAGGASPISSDVAHKLVALLCEAKPRRQVDYGLTPHETRLLTLLVNGHNFKTAAAETGVMPSTIAWHMRHIYEKLGVHSKSEAVAKALRTGIG
jgi:DNA-binding NarL/FixJ family response regulator